MATDKKSGGSAPQNPTEGASPPQTPPGGSKGASAPSEPKEPPKGGPKPPSKSAVADLLKNINDLSDEDRKTLVSAGFVLVNASDEGSLSEPVWGYRCDYCGGIALYFSGTKFTKSDGTQSEQIPLDMPFSSLPWRQDLPASRVNRVKPNCQRCGSQIKMRPGNKARPNFVVQIDKYISAREASLSSEALEKVRRGSMGARMGDASHSYDAPDVNPSDMLSDEAKADIERTAEMTGLNSIRAIKG